MPHTTMKHNNLKVRVCVRVWERKKEREAHTRYEIACLLHANSVACKMVWCRRIGSNCCLAIKKESFIVQVHYKHTKSGSEWNWSFGSGDLRQKTRPAKHVMGSKRLFWNLSKASNHFGAEEEYYIRAPNQYHITLSMGVYTRLIKLIICDATIAVSFARDLDNNYCSITGAVCGLRKKKEKKKNYNKTNGYLFDKNKALPGIELRNSMSQSSSG